MTEPTTKEASRPCARALADARALLARHPAVDLHCDTIDRALRGIDPFDTRLDGAHAGPPRLLEGGFGVAVYVFWIQAHLGPTRGWAHVQRMAAELARVRDRLTGPLADLTLVPALEDARVLLGDGSERALRDRVDALAAWGTCYVTPTWNTGNAWATSCEDTRRGVGLTPRGRDLVARLDDAGIRVDISHLSDRAAEDVLVHARLAPIASHSSARSLCPHGRNLTDALARKVAERGGVIGVNVHRLFLTTAQLDATVDDVVRHIEHLWHVVGDSAVVLGTDFDGIPQGPPGFEHAGRLPELVARLMERGHDLERLVRFVQENARRVLPQVAASRGGAA